MVLSQRINWLEKAEPVIGMGLLILWASSFILKDYFHWSPSQVFYVGLMCLTIHVDSERQANNFYTWLSYLAVVLFLGTFSKVFFTIGVLYLVLTLFTYRKGRLSFIPLFSIILITPFSQYALDIISFPMRLQLTQGAAEVLQWIWPDVSAKGNIISTPDHAFAVDEACMGLNLLQSGFLMSLIMLSKMEQRKGQLLSFGVIILFLSLVSVLIIGSNFFRIITIVLFSALPESMVHDLIGLLCLLTYVLVPVYLIVHFGHHHFKYQRHLSAKTHSTNLLVLPLIIFFIGSGFFAEKLQRKPSTNIDFLPPAGYAAESIDDGILQLMDDSSLVYIKPGVPAYAADHTPKVCWKGNGYRFTGEEILHIQDEEVIIAELLTPENQKLFTAWWYHNGKNNTVSQWKWRLEIIKGAPPYQLINITCTSKLMLYQKIEDWLKHLECSQKR